MVHWTSGAHGRAPTPKGVLIVDDLPNMRDLLQEIVADLDFPTFTAENPAEAMATFRANRDAIGLVITDLKMDKRDRPYDAGTELIEWLTRDEARCRIGVYTSFGDLDDIAVKMRNPAVSFYLPKSGKGDAATLERLVREAVGAAADDVRREFTLASDDEALGDWHRFGDTGSGHSRCRDSAEHSIAVGATPPVLEFSLGEVHYRVVATTDGDYIELAGPGLVAPTRPGTPALPTITERLALPGDLYNLSAELVDPRWDTVKFPGGSARILPVPEPQLEGEAACYCIGPDYDVTPPTLEITARATLLDGASCAVLCLCPFQWDRQSGTLRVLSQGRIRVRGIPAPTLDGDEATEVPDPLSPLAPHILGWGAYEPAAQSAGPTLDGGDHGAATGDAGGNGDHRDRRTPRRRRYLAIGSEENLDAIAPLLRERARNFEVEQVVIGQGGELATDANRRQRQAWILCQLESRSAVTANKPHYVLLVGGDATIPFHVYSKFLSYPLYPQLKAIGGVPLLSDLRYAGFDRREDEESLPQYALGRLPFDDPARLRAYAVQCVERSPSQSWRHWLFLCHRGAAYRANLGDIIDRDHGSHPLLAGCVRGPAIADPIEPAHVDRLFGAAPSLATFRGHGRRFAWEFGDGLTWPHPTQGACFVPGLRGIVSVACCTAAPDAPRSGCGACAEVDACTQYRPLGVSLIESGDCSWFLGSTRPSIRDANSIFHTKLMKAICTPGTEAIGDAHRVALVALLNLGGSDPLILDTAAASILLGDPAAPIGHPF